MKTHLLAQQILEEFAKKGLTLSVAESCTGGTLAAALTSIPGSSAYFLGGVVAYSNEMKVKWLDVSKNLIEKKGAVSREVVEAMIKGLLSKCESDYAIAVTGIAGPSGGTDNKPVGTVWCGIGQKKGFICSWLIQKKGNRKKIMELSVEAILEKLLIQVRAE